MHRLLPLLLVGCRFGFQDVASGDAGVPGADANGAGHVSVSISGHGAVTTTAGAACADQCGYDVTGPVTFTAVADQAWQLDHFTAPCGTAATCTVPPGSAVTAVFTRAPITANVVFISSTAATASTGAAAIDAFCQSKATAAGLGGTFVAFLSTSTVSAKDRIAGKRGWVRVDGLPVFDLPSDLGQITSPRAVQLDETGAPHTSFVMTGSDVSGTYVANSNCSNWSTSSGTTMVIGAQAHWASTYATGGASTSCGNYPVFCFEIDRSVAVALHPPAFPAGRYVFVTAKPFAMTGVAGADAQCQGEASAASLPGTYRAVLATTTQTVTDRIGSFAGVWRRADGIVLTYSGLDAAALDAAPNIDATGALQAYAYAWWGASSITSLGTATSTCNDFTDATLATGIQQVFYTFSQRLLHEPGNGTLCTSPQHLLCAQIGP